jgi:galactokinase
MPRVLGARMMGGGFGGCTINIIKSESIPRVIAEVNAGFNKVFGVEPEHYVVNVEQGTSIIDSQKAPVT